MGVCGFGNKKIQNQSQQVQIKGIENSKSKSLAQLKFEWTIYVVQHVTSMKFHNEVIQN
jgi:hypothetical protein